MPGKSEEWSWEEIRTVILFLDSVGCRSEEICGWTRKVCGHNSVSREEVYRILATDKQAKARAAGRVDTYDVLPTEDVCDIEISDFLDLYDESIFNNPVQSSKYPWNHWNSSRKEQYNRECYQEPQDHPLYVEKTVLYEKLHNIFKNFSPQNFSVSSSEIRNLGITTESNLNEAVDIVFEKAVEKPHFNIPYANLCKLLSLLKVPCSNQEKRFVDTRECLLTKCQKEFENNEVSQLCRAETSKPVQVCEADEKEQLQKTAEEKQKRRRKLGAARFMGWLFKLDIFTESVMDQVIKNLLLEDDEVAAGCLCLLIIAIGNKLDGGKVENYISDLKKIIDKQCASDKFKTILQQISDSKMNNWVSYGEEKSNKLIDEILKEDQTKTEKYQKIRLQMECADSLTDDDDELQKNDPPPSNPEGKKQYDREFLLNLQFYPLCLRKPSNLPNVDVIKDKNNWVSYGDKEDVKQSDEFLKVLSKQQKLPIEVTLANRVPSDMNQQESPLSSPSTAELKQYDREFLLNLQYHPKSVKRPVDLPDLDRVKIKPSCRKLGEMRSRMMPSSARYQPRAQYTDPFVSAFAQHTNPSEPAFERADASPRGPKLEFSLKHIAKPKLTKQMTPEELKQNLQRLLCNHKSNREIFNWLERHIADEMNPPMYRALVTVIYESVITGSGANCELNVSKLKERMCILARYMDVSRNLELHAIFALQYLMNKLDHPKGLLVQIFDLAYDEDFLSGNTFKQWEHCDDPAEQEGKGVAIHSVSTFITWLNEGKDNESAEGV